MTEASPLPVETIHSRQSLSPEDSEALAKAFEALERTSFASRLSGLLGKQIETAGRLVPAKVSSVISKAAAAALRQAMRVALRSLSHRSVRGGQALHRTLAAATGAAGGAFGLAALPLELPISTTVMLRAIADVARSEGEDLSDPATALACLQVFALGGHSATPDILDGGYFALRGFLGKTVAEAAKYVAQKTIVDESAPILARFATQIAARFGIVVSQKVAAQALPVVGAIGGAAVNLAFTEHFQSLARGHFTVRRLERAYGEAVVRAEYDRLTRRQAVPS